MSAAIHQPVLQTPHLILRPYTLANTAELQRMVGAFEVADTTLEIPHSYGDGRVYGLLASEWRDQRDAARLDDQGL